MVVTDSGLQHVAARLRQLGAVTVDLPLLRTVPGYRDARLRIATRRIIQAPVDHVVATTAAGWARWISAATAWGLADPLRSRLGSASILSMNESVSAALVETGFTHDWVSSTGDLGEAVTWLLGRDLVSRRVAVTADDALLARAVDRLRTHGIEVMVVPTRRSARPVGLASLNRLAQMIIQREVHAVTFATAAGANALVDFTTRAGRGSLLLRALATDVAVATAHAESASFFHSREIPVSWPADGSPDELARHLVEVLVARRRQFQAHGHRFTLQGSAVLVNGTTIRLGSRPATVMRSLADHPGHTLSRSTIERLVPMSHRAGHFGVDQAVWRLRAELGDYDWLVATEIGRGYRLIVD
ncbi:uroporphyrinogen-III synthase [Micromonospora sp. ATCC 39149]|uniref:uroporphyrinogen-III synthase n=1 Tax=Micromonospora sp. (strain ATCC 39149 / NRRL 15099 / SCC 1413) TaxID=219305 RepID=UPI0018DBE2B9|nr:uroporphyrinogen-III synthase [Micromonospora sp. ATCC 39149]